MHTVIQDIYKIRTSVIEVLCKRKKGWSSNVQVGPRAISVDPMNIENLKKDKGVEQQSVEAQVTQKDVEEEEVFKVGMQPFAKVQLSTKM
jgi:hypothetical protein